MGRGVDSEILISRSGERGERGRHLSSPYFVLAARATLLAGFENPSPENAGEPILVRLGRPGNRMRSDVMNAHEWSSRIANLARRESGALADLLLALAEFDRLAVYRLLGFASLFEFLHREIGPLPRIRLLPASRGPARPEVPGGGAAGSRRAALHHERHPAREGHDQREPGRGDAEVLPLLEAGGEAGRGGVPASVGGAEEDNRHRGPVPGADGTRRLRPSNRLNWT